MILMSGSSTPPVNNSAARSKLCSTAFGAGLLAAQSAGWAAEFSAVDQGAVEWTDPDPVWVPAQTGSFGTGRW